MTGYWLVSYMLLWALVVALVLITLATLRQLGLVHTRLGGSLGALQTDEGIPLGEPLPITEIVAPNSGSLSLLPSKARFKLILFLSPTCDLCGPIVAQLPPFARATRNEAEVLVILTKSDDSLTMSAGMPPVVVEPHLFDLLGLPGLPYALLVDAEGVVVSKGLINDVVQMRSLLNDAAGFDPATGMNAEPNRDKVGSR